MRVQKEINFTEPIVDRSQADAFTRWHLENDLRLNPWSPVVSVNLIQLLSIGLCGVSSVALFVRKIKLLLRGSYSGQLLKVTLQMLSNLAIYHIQLFLHVRHFIDRKAVVTVVCSTLTCRKLGYYNSLQYCIVSHMLISPSGNEC